MANISISLNGIDQAIQSLNYRPGSVKFRAISSIRACYRSEDDIKQRIQIDSDFLIQSIWDVGNDPVKTRSKRRNFSSLKSSINSDLLKLSEKGLNEENIIIAESNVFDMSEEAKNKLLNSFTDAVKTGDIDLEQATVLLKTVTDFLENYQSQEAEADTQNIADQIKKILNKITESILPDGDTGDSSDLRALKDGDDSTGRDGDDESGLDSGEIDLEEDEELVEIDDEIDDLEEIGLDEDEEIQEVEDLDELDDVEDIEDESALDTEDIEDEDVDIIDLDEDEELVDVDDELDDVEEIEVDEDEEIEEVEGFEELEDLEDIEDESALDTEEIDLDEDEELVDVDDELYDVEEIELDEDEEIEEVEDFEELEDLDDIEDESALDTEEIDLDEDEELVDVDDELDDVEEIELDEDEEIEEVEDLDELDDVEDIEDESDFDTEDIEDEDVDIIDLDEDEELEEIDELDEEELKALEAFREERELAEQFDNALGEKEKKYNAYVTVPEGLYTIGTKKSIKSSMELQQFEMPKVFIGKYPVTNSLFEIFIEETGFVTTAQKRGYGRVYTSRFKKDKTHASWSKRAGSEDIEGAVWYQPGGPGTNIHGKRNHPVVQVSVEDAVAFASWIGRRIPTEAEWEAAARTDLGCRYPWGNEFNPVALNIEDTGLGDTSSVDEFDSFANEFKIADMLGNVMEWTLDMEYPNVNSSNLSQYCVAKGAAWNSKNEVTIGSRGLFKHGFTSNIIGFRCISEILL